MPSTARMSLKARTSPSASMPFRSISPTLAASRRYPQCMRRLLVLVALAVVAGGCGGAKTVTVTTTETVTSTVTRTTAQKTAVRVYFLRDGKVAPVAREASSTQQAELLDALMKGPSAEERKLGLSTALTDAPGIAPASRAGQA